MNATLRRSRSTSSAHRKRLNFTNSTDTRVCGGMTSILRTAERFAIGIQLGQPFSVHAISVLEDLAVVNIFGMLDTIAEDCGYLSITHQLETLWGHVTRHANGLFFNSKFSERASSQRDTRTRITYPGTRDYCRRNSAATRRLSRHSGDHVLIMGNHFAHKSSDHHGILKSAFPTIQFVVLGSENGVSRTCGRTTRER